jgi:hypothetical protein
LHWRLLRDNPWASEFRADPEIAALLEDVENQLEKARGEVELMLQQPEWGN